MAAQSINLAVGCENCTHADCYGRNCAFGLMFPVMVMMAGLKQCPNFKNKTTEQIKEAYAAQREK